MKFIVFILCVFSFSFGDELRDLTNKGISAFKRNDYEKALEYFNEAAQKYPSSAEAKFNRGLALGASGNAKEAEALLSGVKFDKDDKNAEVLYTRARIAEAVGDALAANQQPNFSQAKKAYQTARTLYAQSLDLKKDKKAINNIEILSQKIKNLPEQEEQNQDNQDNKDDNKDNRQDKDNKDKQDKKDGEQNEQNEKDEQNEQEQNEQNNEENEENNQEEQEQNRQEQDEEKVQDAMRLLEHYADDAKELNKPPRQKAVSPPNGKDW